MQNIFRQFQKKVVDIINASPKIQELGFVALSEDSMTIDYEIQQAMTKQGLCIVVMFQNATFQGRTQNVQAWLIDSLLVQVVENPAINRAHLKKLGKEYGTCTDVLAIISDALAAPDSETYGRIQTKSLEVGEDSNLIVGKATFQAIIHF